MTRPYSNALMQNDGTLVLVDFERAKKSIKPQNLTQVIQFVLRSAPFPEQKTQAIRGMTKQYLLGEIPAKDVVATVLNSFIKYNV